VAFVVSWAVLSVTLWRRNPSQYLGYGLTGIAIGLGVLMTFPLFYDLFKPDILTSGPGF
jgi:4-amino-4-deoxy-L-arabinose transferase-like glycosyltransferase